MSQNVLLKRLPTDWRVLRLKRCLERVAVRADAQDGVPFVGLESIESGVGRLVPDANEETQADALQFRRTDVLFGKLRPYLAKAWLAEFDGRCSSELLVLRPHALAPEFLRYWVLSREFVDSVDRSTYGTKMPRAEWDFIGNLPTPVPPLPHQLAIAAFLDRETARIDALIAKKERLLELLEEKRTALITRAVTKGLDLAVPMKESGAEWLGEVPTHWEVRRLKLAVPDITVGIVVTPAKYYVDEGVPCLRSLNISSSVVDLSDIVYISEESNDLHSKSKIHHGDVLVVRTGLAGAAVVVPAELDGANCIDLLIIRQSPRILPEFMQYFLTSTVAATQVLLHTEGAIQGHYNTSTLADLLVPLPPVPEQERISRRLRQETERLTALARSVTDAVALLREYRTALISAAVTGQIDVSER